MIGPRHPNLKPQLAQAKNHAPRRNRRQSTPQPRQQGGPTGCDDPFATAIPVASIAFSNATNEVREPDPAMQRDRSEYLAGPPGSRKEAAAYGHETTLGVRVDPDGPVDDGTSGGWCECEGRLERRKPRNPGLSFMRSRGLEPPPG